MESSLNKVNDLSFLMNSSYIQSIPHVEENEKGIKASITPSKKHNIEKKITVKYDPTKTHIKKEDVKKIAGKARFESQEFGLHTFYLIKWKGKPNLEATWEHPRLFANINCKIIPFNTNIKGKPLPYFDPKYIETCPNYKEILDEFLNSFIEMKKKEKVEKLDLKRANPSILESDLETEFPSTQKSNSKTANQRQDVQKRGNWANIEKIKSKKQLLAEKRRQKNIRERNPGNYWEISQIDENETRSEVIQSLYKQFIENRAEILSEISKKIGNRFLNLVENNQQKGIISSDLFYEVEKGSKCNFPTVEGHTGLNFEANECERTWKDSPQDKHSKEQIEVNMSETSLNGKEKLVEFWSNESEIQPGQITDFDHSFFGIPSLRFEQGEQLTESKSVVDSVRYAEREQTTRKRNLVLPVSMRILDSDLKDYFLRSQFTSEAEKAKLK